MSEREQKALEIAARTKIKKQNGKWVVPSQTGNGTKYTVDAELLHCSCPDHETRQVKCKHIIAVEYTLERESSTTTTTTKTAEGEVTTTISETVTETVKLRYNQVWAAYNSAQTNEKTRFLALLYELCAGIDEPIQTLGRTRYPMADMIFAAAFKVYSMVSSRRFMSDLKESYQRRYISKMPCFNLINHYLAQPEMTPYLQWLITQSSLPLKSVESDFAVDSSGFSTCQYVRWYDEKYGKESSERDWVKAHIMVGTTTNVVTSAEISGAHGADHNYFAPLVNETKKRFSIKEVSADKAYSSYANHRLVDGITGATPYIEFKAGSVGTSKCQVWNRMFHFYQFNRAEFMEHYHKRSNVESTFSMIKAKFGGFIRSKLPVAQTNEVLCKILCHNLCCLIQSSYELGIDATFWE